MESSCRNLLALNAYIQLLLDAASQRDDPMICLELMEIYRLLNRPVSAYGYLLRAKRLGAAINPGVSAEMQNILKTGDIYAASKDPDGAYIMGSELAYYPEYFEPAVYYLQQSVENGDPIFPLWLISTLGLPQNAEIISTSLQCIARKTENPSFAWEIRDKRDGTVEIRNNADIELGLKYYCGSGVALGKPNMFKDDNWILEKIE